MAAWQREQSACVVLETLTPSVNYTLKVPAVLHELCPANIDPKAKPMVPAGVEREWFASHISDASSVKHAEATDLAFLCQRRESANKVGWTLFNQSLSSDKQEVTLLGCLPIIIAPAHDPDTGALPYPLM